MTKADLMNALLQLEKRIEYGCSNNGCLIRRPAVGTNGRCRCYPLDFAAELEDLTNALRTNYRRSEQWEE